MGGASEQLLNKTEDFWQTLANRGLTHEDARQISENLTGFFELLKAWEADAGINTQTASPG